METSVIPAGFLNSDVMQAVISFLLKYANPIVGVAVTVIFEWLKRNMIEKIVALTGQVKKVLYPALVILLSVGIAALIKVVRPVVVANVPDMLKYFPMIANVWVVGISTGVLISLGYKYLTKQVNP